MFECPTCDDEFYYVHDRDEHVSDYDHWIECQTCPKRFPDSKARIQHMQALDHYRKMIECETCDQEFWSQHAVNQHMKAKGHWRNYCQSCDRRFQNENNYRAHMNSKLHRGTTVGCPFCSAKFVTASGASHHLETSSCPNAPYWSLNTIHRAIQKLDPKGVITSKQIEWHEEQNVQYSATDAAFDGRGWMCYLCEKRFNSKQALNAHLNSPVHKAKIYHCLNRRGSCLKEFGSLAALFNHLESESCGYTRFENVQKYHRQLTGAVRDRKMITALRP